MTRYAAVLPVLGLCSLLGCGGDDDGGGNPTPTSTVVPTSTAIATGTASPVQTATQAPTTTRTAPPSSPTPTGIPTGTATSTVPAMSPTPTETPDPLGPEVTFFGVARADDMLQETDLFDGEGRPIYERLLGQGMTLVIEAGRGPTNSDPGIEAYDPDGMAPDLRLLVSRPLGDGSPDVCDYDLFDPDRTGGVPATDPLVFSDDPAVVGAMNDLGCRVNDGTGLPRARKPEDACTQMNGKFDFVAASTKAQFCLPIAKDWAFPAGDTVVAARVRDVAGRVSATREIIIRVLRSGSGMCEGLGQRKLTIARPGSMLLSSAGEGDVSIDPWLEGPLTICAGAQLVDGSYSLTLVEDAIFGFKLVDDTVLCAALNARNSSGTLDCDGGSAHDVLATQEPPFDTVLQIGLGNDAGAGAATLTTTVSFIGLPAGSAAADCQSLHYGGGFKTALTTAKATAVLTNPENDATSEIEVIGANFDCERWTETDSPGTFVFAFPAANTVVGDTVNALILAD